jgi:DNA-directed RNA polymerase specialized sigma24 family protein
MTKSQGTQYLEPSEIERRIAALTIADCLRLETAGRIYASGTGWSPADLLQEAILAALERRRWRADLSTTVFLIGVMRSLASTKRKTQRLNALDRALATEGAEEGLAHTASDSSPEDAVAQDQDAEAFMNSLTKLFADDAQVQRVILGRATGEPPTETKAALGLNQSEYETVCRRLVRRYQSKTKATSL